MSRASITRLVLGARGAWLPGAVALIAFLPFVRGLWLGHCFYFRDLSRAFFPWRRLAVEGLLQGQVWYWNPFAHEGELLTLPPISYPFDLLQVMVPGEHGFSMLLALHVPLAALGFFVFVRGLGVSPAAAGAAALVYGLGGFCVSSLNLYVYVQAMAWAPVAVLALSRAADGGGGSAALAAVAIAILVSTTAAEIVLQAVLLGLLLHGLPFRPARWLRMAGTIALGLALASPTLMVLRDSVAGSERASGFTAGVVLAHSVHPLSLAQVLVANFHGDLSDVTRRFWGRNFFPRGFPYFLSLYLGPVVLALAVVGMRHGPRLRVPLALIGAVALVVCLGRWAGFEPLVEAVPVLRSLRYPAKAFFTLHFVVATLAGLGVHALGRGDAQPAWRWLAGAGLGFAGLLLLPSAVPLIAPARFGWFVAGFFPPGQPWNTRLEDVALMLADARLGALMAGVTGATALLALRGVVSPPIASRLAVAVAVADLLRSAAGVNPMVSPAFYRLSPEMSRVAVALRAQGERAFTCDPDLSARYRSVLTEKLAGRQPHEAWSFAVLMETLTPYFNLRPGVRTAYGIDLTMLVPTDRVLSPEEASCRRVGAILERIREAGVSRVLSLDPLDHPGLELDAVLSPERIRPLNVHVYRVSGALPLRFVATRVGVGGPGGIPPSGSRRRSEDAATTVLDDDGPEVLEASGEILSLREAPGLVDMEVRAERATAVVVREAHAPGWSARVDGRPAPVVRAHGRHLAVRIPAGRARVRMVFRPPHLTLGLALAGCAAVVTLGLAVSSLSRSGSNTIARIGEGDAT